MVGNFYQTIYNLNYKNVIIDIHISSITEFFDIIITKNLFIVNQNNYVFLE